MPGQIKVANSSEYTTKSTYILGILILLEI